MSDQVINHNVGFLITRLIQRSDERELIVLLLITGNLYFMVFDRRGGGGGVVFPSVPGIGRTFDCCTSVVSHLIHLRILTYRENRKPLVQVVGL